MKIPYTNIEIGKIQNIDIRRPAKANIQEKIVAETQLRTKQNISDWVNAVNSAKNTIDPDRQYLMKVYEDIDLDGHITGIITAIKNKVKAKMHNII